jgi:hypothetical protein
MKIAVLIRIGTDGRMLADMTFRLGRRDLSWLSVNREACNETKSQQK